MHLLLHNIDVLIFIFNSELKKKKKKILKDP